MLNRPINITIVIGTMNRGGCERHLLNIMPHLNREEFQITIFTMKERGIMADDVEKLGVPVISPWMTGNYFKNSRLWALLRLGVVSLQLWLYCLIKRPDIVHFFLPEAYVVGGICAILAGRKRLVMSRRSLNYYQNNGTSVKFLEHRLHKFMTKILVNSVAVRDQLLYLENVDPQKLILLYNGVPEPNYRKTSNETRAELGIAPTTPVVSCVANLIPYKGHKDVINALSFLDRSIAYKFLIIGNDNGIAEELKMQARQLGIQDNIMFLGSREDIDDLYRASDLAVLASHEEGFSNAVLESMQAGIPIVATNVGGNAEAVIDQETGFIVPAKNPERLAERLEILLKNEKLRKSMGALAKKRAKQHFSLGLCVTQYEQFYNSIMSY